MTRNDVPYNGTEGAAAVDRAIDVLFALTAEPARRERDREDSRASQIDDPPPRGARATRPRHKNEAGDYRPGLARAAPGSRASSELPLVQGGSSRGGRRGSSPRRDVLSRGGPRWRLLVSKAEGTGLLRFSRTFIRGCPSTRRQWTSLPRPPPRLAMHASLAEARATSPPQARGWDETSASGCLARRGRRRGQGSGRKLHGPSRWPWAAGIASSGRDRSAHACMPPPRGSPNASKEVLREDLDRRRSEERRDRLGARSRPALRRWRLRGAARLPSRLFRLDAHFVASAPAHAPSGSPFRQGSNAHEEPLSSARAWKTGPTFASSSRGRDRSASILQCGAPVLFCIASDRALPPEKRARGLDLITSSLRKPGSDQLDPRVKSLNYMNSVLARRERARRCGRRHRAQLARWSPRPRAPTGSWCATDPRDAAVTDGALENHARASSNSLARGHPASHQASRAWISSTPRCFLTGTGARLTAVGTLDGAPSATDPPGARTPRRGVHGADPHPPRPSTRALEATLVGNGDGQFAPTR